MDYLRSFCGLNIPTIGDLTVLNVLLIVVGLIIIWVIVSVPVYLAGKLVTAGESTLSDAMIATLFGPIVYAATLFILSMLMSTWAGSGAYLWAIIIAFLAWFGVFKASFKTGWLRTLAIALLAILVFAGISVLFGTLLGIMVPAPFFPQF
jgi:hypothetical protein